MTNIDELHSSHQPMSIAADLSNASDLLKRAEELARRAMNGLSETYGFPNDPKFSAALGEYATMFAALRDRVLQYETEEAAERLRHARAH